MDPSYVSARRLLAAALMAAGRVDEASAELEALASDDLDPVSLAWLAHGLAAKGDRVRAVGVLEQLEHLARDRYVSAYHRALAHVAVGDHEGAVELLALALEQRDPAIINLGVDPRFDAISSDRRYQAMVGRLALPA
jgi:tetratricopeptide (TPR) repeat protein